MQLGVIGTGYMASMMSKAVQGLHDIEVVAVLSRSLATATQFCDQYAQSAQPFDKITSFLNSVDAVYIATPPSQHLAAIEAALMAGRPVLCEKPLTTSAKNTAHIVGLARSTGVALVEAIWTLALPTYRAATRTLMHLEEPRRLTFDFSYPLEAVAASHFFDLKTGGVLLDRAVYGFSAALTFLGPVINQSAFVTRDTNGLDRSAELRLVHDGGSVSVVTVSFDMLGCNRLEIAAPNGMLSLGPPSLAAESLQRKPYVPPEMSVAGTAFQSVSRFNRLKTQPALRRLRSQLNGLQQHFYSYGFSPYGPMLTEFQKVVASKSAESSLIPLQMSCDIADMVQDARRQGTSG